MLPDQELHNLDMAYGDPKQDFNKLEQAYQSLEDRSQYWVTHLPKERVKQITYDNKANIAAQRQAKDNTKDARPEIIPQQCHQDPIHHDKKEQQPCFFLKSCVKPNDNAKQTANTFRAWRSAKPTKKKPKGRSQARRHSQARNDDKQHEGSTQADSFL